MASRRASRHLSTAVLRPLVGVLAPAFVIVAQAQSHELVVDLLRTPQDCWNRTVVLSGQIQSIMPDSPGSRRGTYELRDNSDHRITVYTDSLPSSGIEYTVTGVVEQRNPGDTVPCLRETARLALASPAVPPVADTSGGFAPPPAPVAKPMHEAAAAREGLGATRIAPTGVASAPAGPAGASPASPASPWGGVVGLNGAKTLFGLVAALGILGVTLGALRWRRHSVTPPARPTTRPGPYGGGAADVPQSGDAPAPGAWGDLTELYVDLGAELVVIDGPDVGKRLALSKARVAIGRSGGRGNDLILSDRSVSREHCRILVNAQDRSFILVSESTTNPVRLNGERVNSVVLKDNDVVHLGGTRVRFEVRVPDRSRA